MARAFHTGSRHNRTPPRPLHAGKEAILNSTYPTGCTYSRKRNLPIRRAASLAGGKGDDGPPGTS
jgi:hypothetical protein